MKIPKEFGRVHVLEPIGFLELKELVLEGKDDIAHDLVKLAGQHFNHDAALPNPVDLLYRLIKSNGKKLGHHVEVTNDCDAKQLIDQGGELCQWVSADFFARFAHALVGVDSLVRE